MSTLLRELRTSLIATVCLAVLVCAVYPIVVWAVAQVAFAHGANGSFVVIDGNPVGSALIGQPFSGSKYFHPRPSAAGYGYDGANSGGSNLGPISKMLIDSVAARVARYRKLNDIGPDVRIPADAVTSSSSGLDPHISVANALLQAPRVAQARAIGLDDVKRKIETCTEGPQLGIFGEPRVNVLLLNLALDRKTCSP